MLEVIFNAVKGLSAPQGVRSFSPVSFMILLNFSCPCLSAPQGVRSFSPLAAVVWNAITGSVLVPLRASGLFLHITGGASISSQLLVLVPLRASGLFLQRLQQAMSDIFINMS